MYSLIRVIHDTSVNSDQFSIYFHLRPSFTTRLALVGTSEHIFNVLCGTLVGGLYGVTLHRLCVTLPDCFQHWLARYWLEMFNSTNLQFAFSFYQDKYSHCHTNNGKTFAHLTWLSSKRRMFVQPFHRRTHILLCKFSFV